MVHNEFLGKTLSVRQEKIKKWINDPAAKEYDHNIEISKDNWKTVPVFMVPIDFPIYRLENIRTESPQNSYISRTPGISTDFFSDPENRNALQIQHELLFNIANSGDEKNHYLTFQEFKFKKDEPFILNSDGILINGNTRMSALRELYFNNKTDYSHFLSIPMAILPSNVTKENERFIELRLQVNPDIKKKYVWTSEAIAVRKRLKNGDNIENIAQEFGKRISNISHPEKLLSQLLIADKYLEHIKKINDYEILVNNQYSINEIYTFYNKFKNDSQKVTNYLTSIFDYLTESRKGNTSGREFENIKKISKKFETDYDTIIDAYSNESSETIVDEDTSSTTNDDIFSDLSNLTIKKKKVNIKKLEIDSKKSTDILIYVAENIDEEKRRKQNRDQIYDDVVDSIEKFKENIIKLQDTSNQFNKIPETINELENLINKINELKSLLIKK